MLSFLEEETGAPNGLELSEQVLATLREVGINEKNIEKHLYLGFKIIDGEQARKEAIRRCGDLDGYYMEKINLVRESKSATNGNPAGFLIKALQEDWQNPKLQQERKAKEAAKLRAEKGKRVKQLELQKEKFAAEHQKAKAPIFQQLLQNEASFKTAFDTVMAEAGDFMKSTLLSGYRDLTPMEQYHKSAFLENMVNGQLQKMHPELFDGINGSYQALVKQIEEEIGSLKK